jgi:hypothetical protein
MAVELARVSSGESGSFSRILGGALRRLRRPRKAAMNFSNRHDLDSRWRLIEARLPPAPHWYLDVGTNNGDTLRRLAKLGNFAVGLEVSRESAPRIVPDNAAVMIANVTADTLRVVPRFDGVFMLSVFHRIWAIQGSDAACAVLRAAAGRHPLLFFEGSSAHRRWCDLGQPAPEFEDMNADASIAWHARLLAEASRDAAVEFLGVTQSLKTREPRPLFMVSARAR